MNISKHRLSLWLRTLIILATATALLGGSTSFADSAAPAPKPANGSALNTIVRIEETPTGLAILATQVGHLTNFGNFTGVLAYLLTPNETFDAFSFHGGGVLIGKKDDRLFVRIDAIATGADYPRTVTGWLTIFGGTGKFVGARGKLAITGLDEEVLTDRLFLNGSFTVPR